VSGYVTADVGVGVCAATGYEVLVDCHWVTYNTRTYVFSYKHCQYPEP